MKLEQKNSHPRDKRIDFDEKNHVYFVDGTPYQLSVTGFIKSFFEEFDSDKVIQKNYQKWQSDKGSKYYGCTVEEIKNIWKKNAEDASNKGNKLHQDIEAFYNDVKFDNDSIEFNFFISLNDRLKGKFQPYRTEWTIFDEEIKLAGSVDMCYTDKANNFYLFDWKRSKQIKKKNNYRKGKYPLSHIDDANYWYYALQLNMYKYILEKNYIQAISSLFLVRLHPDQQDYEMHRIPDLTSEVNLMLRERLSRIS